MLQSRLFVPLNSLAYQWFTSGQKRWELRRYGRQYTERQLQTGRRVELRRGYSSRDQSVWGTVKNVLKADDLESFFDSVPYEQVIPAATSRENAVEIASQIVGATAEGQPVIGFQVSLDDVPVRY